jgi:hypothetical protein
MSYGSQLGALKKAASGLHNDAVKAKGTAETLPALLPENNEARTNALQNVLDELSIIIRQTTKLKSRVDELIEAK